MLRLLLTSLTVLAVAQSTARPPTVLLISLDAKTDKQTQDYETAFPLTTPAEGVAFDLDGDGVLEQVAWTARSVRLAFLAIDLNENGAIDNGKELVGRQILADAANGIDALIKMRETEHRGLSGAVAYPDALNQKLLLWHDANHNGVCEPSELRPAPDLLTGVGLGYAGFDRSDAHGNRFRFQGWVETRTAPGRNEPFGAKEHFERTRRMYEIVLTTR